MMRKKIGMIWFCCFFAIMSFSTFSAENKKVEELNMRSVFTYGEVLGKEYQMISPFSKEITIGFDIRGRVYGYTSLNRFWGSSTLQAGKIEVKDIHKTENKGTQPQRIEEVKYLTVLKDTEKAYFEGENLVLETPFKEKLIFRRIK